ncbi:hypothetical protein C8F01DRAFT_1078357 [Mycena amicta]|nr:hypothetical protein C8F01DRAFT_1078357 [Mycena amicta]
MNTERTLQIYVHLGRFWTVLVDDWTHTSRRNLTPSTLHGMGQCSSWPIPFKRKRRPYPFAAAYRSSPYAQNMTPVYPQTSPSFYQPVSPHAPVLQSPWSNPTPHAWSIPAVSINPQLENERRDFPFLDWDTSQPPPCAIVRMAPVPRPIQHYHLTQLATTPPLTSMLLIIKSTAPSFPPRPMHSATHLDWPWDTIHVERKDSLALRVGDVLYAIHMHLTKGLTSREVSAMARDEWIRVDNAFRRRVAIARAQGFMGDLKMERLDFLEGHTFFNGMEFWDGEFLLSLGGS